MHFEHSIQIPDSSVFSRLILYVKLCSWQHFFEKSNCGPFGFSFLESSSFSSSSLVLSVGNRLFQYSQGIFPYCCNSNLTEIDKKNLERIFKKFGLSFELQDEKSFDAITAIFGSGLSLGDHAAAAISVVLLAVILQSFSLVWVKRIGATVPAMAVTSGALMIVAPLFALTWILFDGTLPASVTPRASWSIVYLGVFGSVVGFNFYFYVIKRMQAGQIALITLITPVSALMLGQVLNGEIIQTGVWLGAACVVLGLLSHQWQLLSQGLKRVSLRR